MNKINNLFILTLILAFSGTLSQIGQLANNIVGIKIEPIQVNGTKPPIQSSNAMTFEQFAKTLLENPSSLLQIKNIYIIQWPSSSPLKKANQQITSPPPLNKTYLTKTEQLNLTNQPPIKPNQSRSKSIQNLTLIKNITNNKTQVTKKKEQIENTQQKARDNSIKPSISNIPMNELEIFTKTTQAQYQTKQLKRSSQSTLSQQLFRKQPPSSAPLSELRDYMVYITNRFRRQHGSRQLVLNSLFTELAQKHSDDMVKRRFFAHQNPDGQRVADRAKRINYYGMIGQNLALSQSLDKAQEGFKNSAAHFQNAKNSTWQEIGVGIAINQRGQYLITVIFGPRNINQYKLSDEQVLKFRDLISSVIKQQSPYIKNIDEKLSSLIKRWLDSDRKISIMNFVVSEGRYRQPMTAATYAVDYSRDMVDRIQKNGYFKINIPQFSKFGIGCKQNGQKLQIYVIYM